VFFRSGVFFFFFFFESYECLSVYHFDDDGYA